MAVVEGLTAIKDALTELAFARVEMVGQPVIGFTTTLDSLDGMIERWDGLEDPAPDDHYKLGLVIGMLAYMAACKVDEAGEIVPMPVIYPKGNPVAAAACGMRDAVLAFETPTASA